MGRIEGALDLHRRDIASRISSLFSPPKATASLDPKQSSTSNKAQSTTGSVDSTTKSTPSKTSATQTPKTTAKPSSTLETSTTSDPPTTSSTSSETPTTSSTSSTPSSTPATTVTITSVSSTPSPTSTSIPTPTSPLPAVTTSARPAATSGPSTGTKVAIGVVGALAALSLIILCIFWVRRARRNRDRAARQAVLEENGFQRGVGYEEIKGSRSTVSGVGPIFHDERDPSIRRARQGHDAFPMTTPSSWSSQRPPSFEAGPATEQLQTGRATMPAEMPAVPVAAATTQTGQYVAYRPFASQYQTPSGAGPAAAAVGVRKPVPNAPPGGQTEVVELESPTSQSAPKSTANFSRASKGALQIRNS
ncbi:MAG: hypothetical protein M1814_004363 [Vezdaea aestivalis]|nr:MAG: hypothetical protein M1814_004363 [Vezdaea aestivalis]